MFRIFREILVALQALTQAVLEVSITLMTQAQERPQGEDLTERLVALELSRAKWEAEMEAQAQRAETRFKGARAAEERSRKMRVPDEAADEGPPDGVPSLTEDEWAELQLLRHDAEAGGAEEVPDLHQAVAPSSRQKTLAAKWGG